jgi:hypothetical protein
MVTAKTQSNLKNAQQYFEEHLCVGDSYEEAQRVSVRLQNGLGFFQRSSALHFLNAPCGIACFEKRNVGFTMFHSNSDESFSGYIVIRRVEPAEKSLEPTLFQCFNRLVSVGT